MYCFRLEQRNAKRPLKKNFTRKMGLGNSTSSSDFFIVFSTVTDSEIVQKLDSLVKFAKFQPEIIQTFLADR